MTRSALLFGVAAVLVVTASPLPRHGRGLVAPVPAGAASLQKSVYVSVGGSGGDGDSPSGGEVAANTPVAVSVPVAVVKPVAIPVPYPVPVPVQVQTEAERPVLGKPVQHPTYAQQGSGAFVSSFHVSSGNLFDNIFNIPISVLRSVNHFLNNNFRGGAAVHVSAVKDFHYGGGVAQSPATAAGPAPAPGSGSSSSASSASSSASQSSAGSASNAGSSGFSNGDSYASSGSSSSSSSSVVGGTVHKTRSPTFYNDIFNIPVSALTSVNTLLTGGK